MRPYRYRTYDSPAARILRTVAVLAIGVTLAVLAFTAVVWIWVGTTP